MVDSTKCQVCFIDYDLDQHLAVTLSQCGHNFCKFCVDKVLKSTNKTCPTCRKPFPFGHQATKYSIDLNIRSKVENELRFSKCPIHDNKVMNLYCQTDKCRICVECQYNSGPNGHKGHDIDRIQDLEPEIKGKLAVYSEGRNMYQNECVQNRLEETNSFKEIERVGKILALESFLNSKSALDAKETEFNSRYGENPDLRSKLEPKEGQYQHKNLSDAEFNCILDGKVGKAGEASALSQNLVQFSEEIKEAKSNMVTPKITEQGHITKIEAPKRNESIKIRSFLHFQPKTDELVVTANNVLDDNALLDIDTWEKDVKKLTIIFNKFNYNEEDNLVLDYIYTKLQNQLKVIYIEYQSTMSILTPKTQFEEHLIEFPKLVFSLPGNLTKIGLKFVKSKGSDRYIRFLTEKIIPKASNLTALSITCENADLEESSLLDFAKAASLLEHLNTFGLTLKKTAIQPKILNSLRFKFNKLEWLEFGTDMPVDAIFLENFILDNKALEFCTLDLASQSVVDLGVLCTSLFKDSGLNWLRLNLTNSAQQQAKIDEFAKGFEAFKKKMNKDDILVEVNSQKL